jgi:hypothetical protein
MKATIEVPDELYRQVKAKSALEGRAIREVAVELFELYVGDERGAKRERRAGRNQPALLDGEPLPPWFGALRKYARQAQHHDMESIRRSIAAGVAKERGL